MEASRIAEMDVRARARAIRSAKARAEFFCCFFMRGVGMDLGSWKLAGLTFFLEGGIFSGTWHFESSEIDDRDHEQAHQNFSDDAGLPLPRKAL